MKIISGILKGRTILSTKENSYRPTTGKVKEAIFSILASGQFTNVLKDAITIDLFGGTGALTFEAISRGAARGIIIENNINNVKTLELNTKRLGLQGRVQIIKASATALPSAITKCSIAFIDPPFNKELISSPVAELSNKGWLTDQALLVIESHEKDHYDLGPGYSLLFSRNYGKAVLNIYRLCM
jgi:16S rRNA (guanine966-N2)-methyltransferase